VSKRREGKVFKMEWELTGYDPLLNPLLRAVAMETLGSFTGLGYRPTCLCVYSTCVQPVISL